MLEKLVEKLYSNWKVILGFDFAISFFAGVYIYMMCWLAFECQ